MLIKTVCSLFKLAHSNWLPPGFRRRSRPESRQTARTGVGVGVGQAASTPTLDRRLPDLHMTAAMWNESKSPLDVLKQSCAIIISFQCARVTPGPGSIHEGMSDAKSHLNAKGDLGLESTTACSGQRQEPGGKALRLPRAAGCSFRRRNAEPS